MRAAHVYDATMVVTTGGRYRRQATDTTSAWKHIPVISAGHIFDHVPRDCQRVAIEITPDAIPLPGFVHPERAFYIFGPEDGSLPASVINECQHVVQIPTKFCMNLAATVNVVLYDRMQKQWSKADGA